MYDTRIAQVCNDFFVEYKWCGSFLKGFFTGEPLTWTRYSMVPDKSLDDARNTQRNALASHELNWSWNTKIVG